MSENPVEIRIPVPWGHIAGKSWNPDASDHVLMVHGIQHNCGSFDRLIPLLKNTFNVVAIDLPGHGRSSHFPQGSPLELTQFLLAARRVIDYFSWEKFSLVGHSFGGQICTYFAAIFPQRLLSLLVIDTMEPRPVLLQDTLTYYQDMLNQHFELENKLNNKSPPVYTYEQVFQKVKQNRTWTLTNEAAEDLSRRAVVAYRNGYTLTMDQRLKYLMRPVLTFEQQKVILKNIACPVLFILADGNMARYDTYLKEMYEFNSSRENVDIVVVKGDHAVHQNYPERVSQFVDDFLSQNMNQKQNGVVQNGIKVKGSTFYDNVDE